MEIHFSCSQGHKIKAKVELAGCAGKCPRCGQAVQVPAKSEVSLNSAPTSNASANQVNRRADVSSKLTLPNERKTVTESAVMRILGDVAPLPPMPEHNTQPIRCCPRCLQKIRISSRVCEHCQCYVGPHCA